MRDTTEGKRNVTCQAIIFPRNCHAICPLRFNPKKMHGKVFTCTNFNLCTIDLSFVNNILSMQLGIPLVIQFLLKVAPLEVA